MIPSQIFLEGECLVCMQLVRSMPTFSGPGSLGRRRRSPLGSRVILTHTSQAGGWTQVFRECATNKVPFFDSFNKYLLSVCYVLGTGIQSISTFISLLLPPKISRICPLFTCSLPTPESKSLSSSAWSLPHLTPRLPLLPPSPRSMLLEPMAPSLSRENQSASP